MAVGIRFSESFRYKIENAYMNAAGRASAAGAELAADYLREMISGWNRQPVITVKKSQIVTSGSWRQLHAYLSVRDVVRIQGVDRFKILDEGANTSPNGVGPVTRKRMRWIAPYVSRTTGVASGFSPDSPDGYVYSNFVGVNKRKIAPMAFMKKILAEHKQDIIAAVKEAFNQSSPSSDY